MEKGKTGRYLKYAFGEIILVVIGILIALQINNWNDNQKEKKELHEHLTKVRNDIKLDIAIIDSLFSKRTRVQKNCEVLITKIIKNEFDLNQYFDAAEAFDDTYFSPNQNGYEALKNSSYLGKISGTKVDSLLDDYNNSIKQLVKEEEGFFAYIESMESIWTSQVDLISLLKIYYLAPKDALAYFESNEAKETGVSQDILNAFSNNSFIAVVTRTSGQTLMLRHYNELIEKGQKTIDEINRYITD